jgi:hypothetical protein
MGSGRPIQKQRKGSPEHEDEDSEAQYLDGKKYVPKASLDKALRLGSVVWVD